LKNFSIGVRLGLGFLVMMLLTLAIGATGAFQANRIYGDLDYYTTNTTPSLEAVTSWSKYADEVRVLEAMHIMANTDKDMTAIEADVQRVGEKLQKTIAAYEALASNDEDKRLWGNAKGASQTFLSGWDKLKTISRQTINDPSKSEEARNFYSGASQQEYQALTAAIAAQWEFNTQLARAAAEHGKSTFQTALIVLAVSCVVALLTGIAAVWWLANSIVRPLTKAVNVAQSVAAGDLTVRIDVDSRDETGQLMLALKNMNDGLVNIVSEVRDGTQTVASASQQIASGNADLSSRTEEQASSLEETASSMEELTSTVKQNADNARQANQLAVSASEVAVKGGAVVSEVVGTMGEINESAKKIVDIIGVIDGIAFQTNILALNAAVEAARAGEQGRGFAVVAAEVRSLAQRSAAAAKEIKALIDHSVGRVDAGSKLVDQAGTTMQEVVGAIRRVTDIVGEISAASQEQTAGIEQVQRAIMQMDETTQQNASLVEEAAAASEALKDQAGKMVQVVGVFKLNRLEPANQIRATVKVEPVLPKTQVAKVQNKPAKLRITAQATSGDEWEQF
jgi:methyl-accepting chemotaxis protein